MKVQVNIADPLKIEESLDLGKTTMFIGPNLAGKSLLLRCIFSSITKAEKYILTVDFNSVGECSIDEEFNYAIYVDPYAVIYFLYDKYKSLFEEEETSSKHSSLTYVREDVKGILRLAEIRSLTRDDDLVQAANELNNVLTQISEELKEVEHEEEVKYIYPLKISVISRGIEWKDAFGNEGNSVNNLPPSFYPSFIVTAALYSYALSKKRVKVLLLLDEPDAFAYPSFAYTMGRIIRNFSNKSEYFYTLIITHNWDFYKGMLHDKPLNLRLFKCSRNGNTISIRPLSIDEWYIPGLSVSAVLR
ncbi:hypothetical protein [Sulfurisphaera ohwakuensis]|uniref:AAA15 family ATPase/GTPase n=1 Tax=Sulfurisphaera ohwakuensis TaxID=69656 RepID=A0A650CKI9_SULOH|nr:hypothetical protein [Sulfurisphaera ohwakuensis]MBB5254602.1 AAA15 family ATPase/GTPase [Sulfurisphaera ohwakuensis]QGR18268.1 hypothetical protein D1869_14535 [Sulfurisphaera ohwakuensis]